MAAGPRSSPRSAIAGEATVRRPHHTTVAYHHALGAQQRRLTARVTGDQSSVAAHHTPPRQLDVGRREQCPDRATHRGGRRRGRRRRSSPPRRRRARRSPPRSRGDSGVIGAAGTSPRPHRAWGAAESHLGADVDAARPVGDLDAVEQVARAVGGGDRSQAGGGVERHDHAVHGTILEIGSSSRSVAPASDRAGMIRLIVRLSTTLSTAKPPLASFDTVGDLADGRTASTRVVGVGGHVELEQHLGPGVEGAVEQRHQLAHRVALVGVEARRLVGDDLRVAGEDGVDHLEPGRTQGPPGLGDLHHAVGDVGDLGLARAVADAARRRRRPARRSSAG